MIATVLALLCRWSPESTDIILISQQFGTHSESERKTEKYDAQVSSWGTCDTIKDWALAIIWGDLVLRM